jgi:hypothetical protein
VEVEVGVEFDDVDLERPSSWDARVYSELRVPPNILRSICSGTWLRMTEPMSRRSSVTVSGLCTPGQQETHWSFEPRSERVLGGNWKQAGKEGIYVR